MTDKLKANAFMGATGRLQAAPASFFKARINQHFKVECFDPQGNPKWVEEFDNLVVNVGLDEYLQRIYKALASRHLTLWASRAAAPS